MKSTQLPIRLVAGTLISRIKRPRNKVNHPFPSGAEIIDEKGYIVFYPHAFMAAMGQLYLQGYIQSPCALMV